MANTKSAKKAAKQNEKRRIQNVSRMSSCKTYDKKLRTALDNSTADQPTSFELFKTCQAKYHRAVSKGIIKINKASRKIASLHLAIKKRFDLQIQESV